MKYILYRDEQECGPYSIDEIIKSVDAGYIEPSAMAREQDSDQWVKVSAVIAHRQKPQATPPNLPSSRAKEEDQTKIIGTFVSPRIVDLLFTIAVLFFILGIICLLSFLLGVSLGLAISWAFASVAGGIALIVVGRIINYLAECAFRLRNIEFNTAKAAEKN